MCHALSYLNDQKPCFNRMFHLHSSLLSMQILGFFMLTQYAIALRIILLFTLCSFLSSCDLKHQPPLKVGTNIWPGYEIFYLARHLGYLQNTAIKMVELPSATEVSHAFRNHLLDVAALTLDEALTLAQHDQSIRVIAVIDISHGGDVLLASPSIGTLAAMKGKRIGVENAAVGAILLDGALTEAHLQTSEITLVPLSIDEHLSAYQQGNVDAVVTFEPVKSQLLALGAKQLFDSSKIPNRIVDVLVTHQAIVEQRPEQLKQLLIAYFKALNYFTVSPEQAAIGMADRLQLAPEEVRLQFKGMYSPDVAENKQLLVGRNPSLKISANHLIQLMLKQHLLFKKITTDPLINSSFLPTEINNENG